MRAELSSKEIWQSDHANDLRQIQRYQSEHPDTVSDLRLDWGPPARVRVLLWPGPTSSMCDEILDQLQYPADVVFDTARFSPAALRELLDEVRQLTKSFPQGVFASWGPTWDAIVVELRADQEALAWSLHERFGDELAVRLGAFPFPLDRTLTVMEELRSSGGGRPRQTVELAQIDGVTATLEVKSTRIHGGPFDAYITLSTIGSNTLEFIRGLPIIRLADPKTGDVVGGFRGAVAAVGIDLTLFPGKSERIPVLTGTDSFRPELGYVLPPGRYLAHAVLNLSPRQPADLSRGGFVRTPNVGVELLARES